MNKSVQRIIELNELAGVSFFDCIEMLAESVYSLTDSAFKEVMDWFIANCSDYTSLNFTGFEFSNDNTVRLLVLDVKVTGSFFVVKVLPCDNYQVREDVIIIKFKRVK